MIGNVVFLVVIEDFEIFMKLFEVLELDIVVGLFSVEMIVCKELMVLFMVRDKLIVVVWLEYFIFGVKKFDEIILF